MTTFRVQRRVYADRVTDAEDIEFNDSTFSPTMIEASFSVCVDGTFQTLSIRGPARLKSGALHRSKTVTASYHLLLSGSWSPSLPAWAAIWLRDRLDEFEESKVAE